MATDQTPPRNRLIATITLVTLCVLVALKFILTSYYTQMTEAEQRSRIKSFDEIAQLRAEHEKQLRESPVSIDVAMQTLASRGRDGSELIAPQQSDDTAVLTGWAKAPKPLPPKPELPPPPAATAEADGGAPLSADGSAGEFPVDGAAPTSTDAGTAPTHVPDHPGMEHH
jgi:cytoskeletal protein RodZ